MDAMRGSTSSLISHNRLLACLPKSDHRRLAPELEPVSLKARHVAYEPGKAIDHVYFPLNSVVSIAVGTDRGREVEVAAIGNEGMVVCQSFWAETIRRRGGPTPLYRAIASGSPRRRSGNMRGNRILR